MIQRSVNDAFSTRQLAVTRAQWRQKKLVLALALIAVALAGLPFYLPPLMERSLSWWLRYQAGRSGFNIAFSEIRAPFREPITIRNVHITRAGVEGRHLEVNAPVIEATLRLSGLISGGTKSHLLRTLQIQHARLLLRGRSATAIAAVDWPMLARLLPDDFDLSADEIRLDQPVAHLEMRDARFSANAMGSGVLSVASIHLAGPLLRQTFGRVRGVTRWQDERLTLGAIRLRDGLTMDSLVLDFSRLRSERLAIEIALSAFGGNIRANAATEHSENARIWEGAASATGVSLAQLAGALGVTEPITGSLRASKFTFRGDPRDFLKATASIWTELTGFSWRERKADVIMVGANFYDRSMQLQELYIKQRQNEFTLSGETNIGMDWLNPDFSGDIAASINDLGQFAELFGQPAGAFLGKVAIRGRVHARERKIDGQLAFTGDALKIFRAPVESLTARIGFDSSRVQLEQFELKEGTDFLRATGEIDFANNRQFTVSATSECRELGHYPLNFPLLGKLGGAISATLEANGDATGTRSTFTARNDQCGVSARVNWRGDLITVESLDLSVHGGSAELNGEIDLMNRHHVRANFTSSTDLRVDLPAADGVCLRGLQILPGQAGQPFASIQFDGDQLFLDHAPRAKLCSAEDNGEPLRVNIVSREPATTPVTR
jgi:hypothetical protein